jgi:hypothetical protein
VLASDVASSRDDRGAVPGDDFDREREWTVDETKMQDVVRMCSSSRPVCHSCGGENGRTRFRPVRWYRDRPVRHGPSLTRDSVVLACRGGPFGPAQRGLKTPPHNK